MAPSIFFETTPTSLLEELRSLRVRSIIGGAGLAFLRPNGQFQKKNSILHPDPFFIGSSN